MARIRVKICGLTRIEDVNAAIDSGSDGLGFIFGYPASRRNLSFDRLEKLIKTIPPYVSTVVVSPATNPELERVSTELRPSFLQLYSENGTSRPNFSASIIETVYSRNDFESLILQCKQLTQSSVGILLDSAVANSKLQYESQTSETLGGSGATHDWKLGGKIRDALYPFPLILAGGLQEGNVQEAIRLVRPFAVDVSSGVESSPGIKDRKKMKNFIENAKAVEIAQS
jgi:phosphoribosylanthranilate isomerase